MGAYPPLPEVGCCNEEFSGPQGLLHIVLKYCPGCRSGNKVCTLSRPSRQARCSPAFLAPLEAFVLGVRCCSCGLSLSGLLSALNTAKL